MFTVVTESIDFGKRISIHSIETDQVVIITTYTCRRTANAKISKLIPETNPYKVVLTVLKKVDTKIELSVHVDKKQILRDLTVNVQTEQLNLTEISSQIGDETINIIVEGRKPRCFECGRVGYIVSGCPKDTMEVTNVPAFAQPVKEEEPLRDE